MHNKKNRRGQQNQSTITFGDRDLQEVREAMGKGHERTVNAKVGKKFVRNNHRGLVDIGVTILIKIYKQMLLKRTRHIRNTGASRKDLRRAMKSVYSILR